MGVDDGESLGLWTIQKVVRSQQKISRAPVIQNRITACYMACESVTRLTYAPVTYTLSLCSSMDVTVENALEL